MLGLVLSWYCLIELVARILLAHIFVLTGINKILGYDGTTGYMEAMGVPRMLLPLVIILEVGGGLALLVGFKTRLAAAVLAAFTVVAALLFHADFGDKTQMIMFMKNWAMVGGLLMVYTYGAGKLSVDKKMGG